MTLDYSKQFASGGGKNPLSDSNYNLGFDYLGSAPPTIEDFNWLFNLIDQKFLNLFNASKQWLPSHNYSLGDIITSTSTNSYEYMECTTAGTSGTSEPAWGAVETTVTDNFVTWTVRDFRDARNLRVGGTISGSINEAAVTMASASTMNIGAAAGNTIFVTGTTTVTAFDAVQQGTKRTLIAGGAFTLTYNSTSMQIQGKKNINLSAGDRLECISLGSGNWACSYHPVAGVPTINQLDNFNLFKKFKSQVTSNTAISTTANYNPYTQTSMSLTINTGTSGAGGIDTGSITVSTWYARHIIYGTSGISSILSLSDTSPTLPSGYKSFTFTGWVRTDSSGNLLRTLQTGKTVRYVVTTSTNTPSMPQMASGTTSSVWSSINVSNFVSPTALKINVSIGMGNNGGTAFSAVAPNNSYTVSQSFALSNVAPMYLYTSLASQGIINVLNGDILLEGTSIYYVAGAGSSYYLYCYGWEENL